MEATRPEIDERTGKVIRYHARFLARRLPPCLLDADNLEQEGAIAVLETLRAGTYDPAAGKLHTYVAARVMGSMRDALRQADWVSRRDRGRQKRGEAVVVPKVVSYHAAEWEREMGDAVGAGKMVGKQGVSYRTDPPHHDPERTDPAEVEFLAALRRVGGSGLRAAERRLMVWYYCRGVTMKEIAERLGLSESRVSQLHSNIIGRLYAGCGDEAEVRAELLG